jgi:tetratricopeptide (TPR) repeat protein
MRMGLLILGLAGGLSGAVLPVYADVYTQGIQAYKQGQYTQAVRLLEQAAKIDPSNANTSFYLALSYSRSGQYTQARTMFENVGRLLPPNHPLAIKARNNMAVLTQAQITSVGNDDKARQVISQARQQNNYLAYAIPKGKIIHWDPAKMPLKVFISNGSQVPGWKPEMTQLVHQAMSAWQSATGGRVRFATVSDPNQADIVLRWQRNFAHNKIGENPFESLGNTIVRSDLTIATHLGESGPPMPLKQVGATILHEFGHVLGIQGHSPYPEDMMYFSDHPAQSASLTSRDITTIKMLYQLDADIKNNGAVAVVQSKSYFNLLREGAMRQTQNDPRGALQQYIRAMALNQTDPDLYFNMALAYYQLSDYPNAIKYYRKVISLDRNQYDAKYNLGVLLINEGVRLAEGQQQGVAKRYFNESVGLLEDVMRSPKPPTETSKVLQVARQNLVAMQ